ncbi:hypothetical protein [Dysgonomonas sp. 520]|uniref:hypothetical protein n=1 Tax=Dysgonomonas sp. 520 TaxID=2302931 RepID=UPI0013CF68D6|nr:hypothetical protein [Dysgonomonas sp. 520]NDW08375.1 hypothetical protein [Dysgonomonas sp. 520]
MLTSGHKKYLKNPTLGLTPFMVFLLSFAFSLEIVASLVIGLGYALIVEAFLRYYAKSKVSFLTFGVVSFPLLLTLITKLILVNHIYSSGLYILLTEMYLVCLLMIARAFKDQIIRSFFWNKNYSQKPFLDDFFNTARFTQYILTLHLFYMIIYLYIRDRSAGYEFIDMFSYVWFPFLCGIGTIIYENMKIIRLSRRLSQESWLPIVNEKGEVSGKIAKSETLKLKNKFMHPVIRIALIYKDQIYLQPRKKELDLETGAWDHPFEKYLMFNDEINIAARNSIADILDKEKDSNFRFLIKYSYKNEEVNRLVFLYTLRMDSEETLSGFDNLNGKFWTMKQIEENIEKDHIFSECFMQEYEYMKNTILMTEKIKNANMEQLKS